MMKETDWHYYHQDGHRYRMQVEYGIDYAYARQHHQAPYFSMDGTIEVQAGNNRWTRESGGWMPDEIRRRFPALARYVKWHLMGPEGSMHYLENAKYWLGVMQGKAYSHTDTDPMKAFRETVKFGAFPGDSEYIGPAGPKEWSPRGVTKEHYSEAPWSKVRPWLEARLPKLVAAWVVDMGELGVLEE